MEGRPEGCQRRPYRFLTSLRGRSLCAGHSQVLTKHKVYIPEVNWALCLMCLLICITFKTSGRLAGAYGIAVTSTFLITTFLLGIVIRKACLA